MTAALGSGGGLLQAVGKVLLPRRVTSTGRYWAAAQVTVVELWRVWAGSMTGLLHVPAACMLRCIGSGDILWLAIMTHLTAPYLVRRTGEGRTLACCLHRLAADLQRASHDPSVVTVEAVKVSRASSRVYCSKWSGQLGRCTGELQAGMLARVGEKPRVGAWHRRNCMLCFDAPQASCTQTQCGQQSA